MIAKAKEMITTTICDNIEQTMKAQANERLRQMPRAIAVSQILQVFKAHEEYKLPTIGQRSFGGVLECCRLEIVMRRKMPGCRCNGQPIVPANAPIKMYKAVKISILNAFTGSTTPSPTTTTLVGRPNGVHSFQLRKDDDVGNEVKPQQNQNTCG